MGRLTCHSQSRTQCVYLFLQYADDAAKPHSSRSLSLKPIAMLDWTSAVKQRYLSMTLTTCRKWRGAELYTISGEHSHRQLQLLSQNVNLCRIRLISAAFGRLPGYVFHERILAISTKTAIYDAICISILLYVWTLNSLSETHIKSLETVRIKCLREIQGLRWWHIVRLTEIRHRSNVDPVEVTLQHEICSSSLLKSM